MAIRARLVLFASALSFISMLTLLIASCSSDDKDSGGLSTGCLLNSDCKSPLACSFGRCHQACAESRDCPPSERCIKAGITGVCELPEETKCSDTTSCVSTLVCASDQQCRAPCQPQTSGQCLGAQVCLATQSAESGACFDTSELDGGAGVDASVGSNDATGGAGDSGGGPDGSSGGTGGSDGGVRDGSEFCDATLLANGSCDYCPRGACAHGTCVSGNSDYTCQCDMGYTLNGKTCQTTDSCKANNQCVPEYPCQNGAPPGQVCMGQYAAWPVADSTAPAPSVSPSFSNNGDGTVTDGVSRLVWQIAASPAGDCAGAPADAGAGADGGGPSCTAADAKAYCVGLNLAGHNDWRLPSKIELESLLDFSRAIDPLIAPPFLPLPSTFFLNATPAVSPLSGSVWVINFAFSGYNVGPSHADPVSNFGALFSARCVRGTGVDPTTPPVHYTIHPGAIDAGVGDAALTGDTVTDNWTGLTWERTIRSAYDSLPAGRSYCAALGAGFRIPTLKELLTLVDPVYGRPAIDPITFPGGTGYVWSSTVIGGLCTSVNFYDGGSTFVGATCVSADNGGNARCVR